MRMAVIMMTIVFSVHKKLFSFGSPQNRNFPAVEKEIAKKNSLRNNCIEVLSKGSCTEIMRFSQFHEEKWNEPECFHHDCDDNSTTIWSGKLRCFHSWIYKCDLWDLHLIHRRQIYDQQFCHGRVILSNVYENLCCKSFLVVNVPITTAVILNIDLMLTYVMCVCKNNTYSSVNNV